MTRAATKANVSRRKFLVSGAAAGGGLALGVNVPGLGDALAQGVLGAEGSEVGAWVVIKPNEDVIIRIARSEMGQGTLTGLAQLVCEELECDWKKVKWEYPTPGKNLARNRIWGDMSTGGSRGIRGSHEYVRKGGAAARTHAAAGGGERMEGAGRRAHRRRRRHQARQVQPHHDLRQGGLRRRQAAGARSQGHQAQGPEGLEGRRQAAQAPRHGRQADRQAALRHRREAAGHADRLDDGCAGVRRQGQELRRGEGQGDARRAPRAEGRRHRRCRGGRHLVAGQPGPEGAQHRLGGGAQRQGLERVDHGLPQGGSRHQGGRVRRQPGRRCAAGDRRRGQEVRGGVLLALPEPRLHGADELHGQGDGRQVRGVGRHAERRCLAGGRCRGLRPAARASARSTSITSAAASAGAACRTT